MISVDEDEHRSAEDTRTKGMGGVGGSREKLPGSERRQDQTNTGDNRVACRVYRQLGVGIEPRVGCVQKGDLLLARLHPLELSSSRLVDFMDNGTFNEMHHNQRRSSRIVCTKGLLQIPTRSSSYARLCYDNNRDTHEVAAKTSLHLTLNRLRLSRKQDERTLLLMELHGSTTQISMKTLAPSQSGFIRHELLLERQKVSFRDQGSAARPSLTKPRMFTSIRLDCHTIRPDHMTRLHFPLKRIESVKMVLGCPSAGDNGLLL